MTEEEKKIVLEAEEIIKKEATKTKAAATKKRKGIYSKIIIFIIFAYLFYFTERVLGLFEKTGSEPVVIIGAVFSILGLECGVLAWIKNTKIKRGN